MASDNLTSETQDLPVHPKGKRARLLLTSVFGPYAQDDEYGSRAINPMELYHNQVTRVQGPFSLRMFHRSWGLMLIQHNLSVPSALLDFPTQERFVRELQEGDYDVVGIGSIVANIHKVAHMCRLIRRHSPHSKIVIGGHIASKTDLDKYIDADFIVRGEGVRWFRHYFGEDENAKINHPDIISGFGTRMFGWNTGATSKDTAATLITSVGCPMGCNFCATSALFGGKGHSVDFYKTGQEIYDLMCGFEQRLGTQSFFIMDENFLLNRPRSLELLDLMEKGGKSWSLYCFSSANALRQYTFDELVRLGVSWLWMGLEGEDSMYAKLKNFDTLEYVPKLQEHGIKVLGSSIIGLETHTPENIDEVISRAVRHKTDFHQFMLYTPLPGTSLFKEQSEKGAMIDGTDLADIHGQFRFNFRHPHITQEQSTQFLLRAFQKDFDDNGPSMFRVIRTMHKGWVNNRDHSNERVRARFEREISSVRNYGAGALWAMEHYLRPTNKKICDEMAELRDRLNNDFGTMRKIFSKAAGPFILGCLKREALRLRNGYTIEPQVFYEKRNWVNP